MASIEKRGKSYRITVSDGSGVDKRKNIARMSWTPPFGMKLSKVNVELDRIKHDFETKVKNGHYLDGETTTLAEFVDTWMKDYAEKQLKPKTIESYRYMLTSRIIPAIGHHKLVKIQPAILIKFMNALQESGLNENVRYQARPGIAKTWKDSTLKLSDTGLSKDTLTSILNERHISFATAEKFAAVMKRSTVDLFMPVEKVKDLSTRTVGYYMRCISTVLSTAVSWQLIETNPCERVRSPKVIKKQIKFLEIDDTHDIIKAAMRLDEMRTQTAILTFLYTGIRKGELCGLQWSDIDMETGTLSIKRVVQQIDGQGLVTCSPKTESGERSFSISTGLISQLRRYKDWQMFEQKRMGDKWQQKDREAWMIEGTEKDPRRPEDFQPVDWVFTAWNGYPLHPSTIYHWIKQFLVDNGHGDMTVHGLRHSNISLLLSQGVDLITVSRRAGHAKPSITADIYAHALKKPDEAAADKLNDLLCPSVKNS